MRKSSCKRRLRVLGAHVRSRKDLNRSFILLISMLLPRLSWHSPDLFNWRKNATSFCPRTRICCVVLISFSSAVLSFLRIIVATHPWTSFIWLLSSIKKMLGSSSLSVSIVNLSHFEMIPIVRSINSFSATIRMIGVLRGALPAGQSARNIAFSRLSPMNFLIKSSVCMGRSAGSSGPGTCTRPGRSIKSIVGTEGDLRLSTSMRVEQMPVTLSCSFFSNASIASRTSISPEEMLMIVGSPSTSPLSRLSTCSSGGDVSMVRRSSIFIGSRVHIPIACGKSGNMVMRSSRLDLPVLSPPRTINRGGFQPARLLGITSASESSTSKYLPSSSIPFTSVSLMSLVFPSSCWCHIVNLSFSS